MTDEISGPSFEATNGPDMTARSGWAATDTQTKIATAGVIVVAAALIEVGLIPGMIVGAAAVLVPKYVPQVGGALRPAFRSVVRGAYRFGRKAREAAAEAKEQVGDIVAEVHAEDSHPQAAAPGTPPA